MTKYELEIGVDYVNQRGYLAARPPLAPEIFTLVKNGISGERDSQRRFGFLWSETAMEIMATHTNAPDMINFRSFIGDLIQGTGEHEVVTQERIIEVPKGEHLLDHLPEES